MARPVLLLCAVVFLAGGVPGQLGHAQSQNLEARAVGKSGTSALPAPGWERATIPDVGTVDIPPSMEVLGGRYAVIKKGLAPGAATTATASIVIHQKGLNELDPEAMKLYVRVMLATDEVDAGEVASLEDSLNLSNRDLAELPEELKSRISGGIQGTAMKVLEWDDAATVANVGQVQAIYWGYRRQLRDNPPVIVKTYMIQNYDRIHRLTVSYRESEAALWTPYFPKMLSSLRITNVRGTRRGSSFAASREGDAVTDILTTPEHPTAHLVLLFVISAVLTWGIGLSVPLLLRYVILRRPAGKGSALAIVIGLGFVNLVIFVALGSQSKIHAALLLVGIASYYILRAGLKRKEQPGQRRGPTALREFR